MEDKQKSLAYEFDYLKRFERRYMMELSRLIKVCRDCPFVENCQNKRMQAEALAYLPMTAEASILRETMTVDGIIDCTIGEELIIDDIKRKFEKRLQLGG